MSKISLQGAICEFISFHLRKKTNFFHFVLAGAEVQLINDTQFVWMFTEGLGPTEVPVFLSVDTETETVHVIRSFDHNHTTGFPADEIYLEVMISFLDDIIAFYNEQTEPSEFLYPVLVQSAIYYYCTALAELLLFPGAAQFMSQKQYGRISGQFLYWWSESTKQWFCLDTLNKCLKSVINCQSDPQSGILPGHFDLIASQRDSGNTWQNIRSIQAFYSFRIEIKIRHARTNWR